MKKGIIEKDYSISFVRLVATIMIVTCHMMLFMESELAWWFNVGVQIFLCMSGYLYGKKVDYNCNDIIFLKNQFFKIMIDYYVVVILIIILQLVIVPEAISFLDIKESLLGYGTLSGGGHLWYIPYMMFCYLLTPFSIRLFTYFERKRDVYFIICILMTMLIVVILTNTFLDYFNSNWINCYIIGLFLGFLKQKNKEKLKRRCIKLLCLTCVVMNFVKIYIDYFTQIQFSESKAEYYDFFCKYAHVALGCTLFFVMRELFFLLDNKRRISTSKKVKLVSDISDSLSYDIYLIHQFLIIGPFSLMQLTQSMVLNIIIIWILICLGAILVKMISDRLRKILG